MKKTFRQNKSWIAAVSALTTLAFLFSSWQSIVVAVSAEIVPIVVQENQLDFGSVFPSEGEKTADFTVQLAAGYEGEVFYQISQQIKPRPDVVVPAGFAGNLSQYCQTHPDDLTRCYQNLCPFLTKVNSEGEGDTEAKSSVGPGDLADLWSVNLAASAVFGAGVLPSGVITERGVYGCDVSVAIMPTVECTDNDGDGYFAQGGICSAADCDDNNLTVRPDAAEICNDGIDNNCDGLADAADASACGQGGPEPACSDEIDNDSDGLVDLADPGCTNAEDNDETNSPPAPVYQCSDGLDNDGDGLVDFPADAGCASASDDDETNSPPAPVYQCSDGIDNDGDGLVDFPADAGCASATDNDETGIFGGAGPRLLVLHTESAVEPKEVSVMVIWFTSYPATSRVVYDTVPQPDIDYPPNYGYAFSTIEDSNKVTYHQVTISGLTPGTTYYWRGISHGSPEVFTEEFKFVTQAAPVVPLPWSPSSQPPAAVEIPAGPGVLIGEQAWQLPASAEASAGKPSPGVVLGEELEGKGERPQVSGNVGVGTGITVEPGKEEEPAVEVGEPAGKETVEVAPVPAAAEVAVGTLTCKNLIWALLILNLLLTLAIYFQERKKRQNFWAALALLIVIPIIIWYPACGLVWWLAGIAGIEILYLIWQSRRPKPLEISSQPVFPPVPTSPPTDFKPTVQPPAEPAEKVSGTVTSAPERPTRDFDFFPPIE